MKSSCFTHYRPCNWLSLTECIYPKGNGRTDGRKWRLVNEGNYGQEEWGGGIYYIRMTWKSNVLKKMTPYVEDTRRVIFFVKWEKMGLYKLIIPPLTAELYLFIFIFDIALFITLFFRSKLIIDFLYLFVHHRGRFFFRTWCSFFLAFNFIVGLGAVIIIINDPH